MIGYYKNYLFRNNQINIEVKRVLEQKINDVKKEWDHNYEIIRNKFCAHHQELDEISLIEWWNEIDYSTITFFYEGMGEIRLLLKEYADFNSLFSIDYEEIDFSDTCLQDIDDSQFFLSHDRLAITKKNTSGIISCHPFQSKCMLILTIIDFIFINCALTLKVQKYTTYYKKILFDTAWLLMVCDTYSLIENLYDSNYSLLSLSPSDWKGKTVIQEGNSKRDNNFEYQLKELRNKFAAHIDTNETLDVLLKMYDDFDLKQLHQYCIFHMNIFREACQADIRTKMFLIRDQKLPNNVLGLAYSAHKTINN